jgi:hypothetical protein
MRVLVGCERSGIVRDAFRRLGHEAWSCDLEDIEPGGEWRNYHLFGDVRWFLEKPGVVDRWDIGIFFPDCTFLTNSAAWAYGDGPYHQRVNPSTLVGAARRKARASAVSMVLELWRSGIPKICIENPVGHLSNVLDGRPQIIQPNQFGHDASKATCLWLKNLPRLQYTRHVAPRMVGGRKRWANQTDGGQNKLTPSSDRAMLRAETYAGVADAMASQWSTWL